MLSIKTSKGIPIYKDEDVIHSKSDFNTAMEKIDTLVGGGGGGAVDSVNGMTGDVVLKAEDIDCNSGNTIEDEIQGVKDNILYIETPDMTFFQPSGTGVVIPDFTVKQIRDAYNAIITGKRVVLITNRKDDEDEKLEIEITCAKKSCYRDSTTYEFIFYKQINFIADFVSSIQSTLGGNVFFIRLTADENALDTDTALSGFTRL